jgi:hypothetical protein
MGNDSFNPAVYGAQTNAIPYPYGANVQLTVYNWDDGFHPFHFHGYVLFIATLHALLPAGNYVSAPIVLSLQPH